MNMICLKKNIWVFFHFVIIYPFVDYANANTLNFTPEVTVNTTFVAV